MTAIDGRHLATLTVGKSIATTAFRWIPFFLPTLAVAFSSSTTELTIVLGVGEVAALATLLAGRHLDAGHEHTVMVLGLVMVSGSAGVALVGTLASFALCFVLLTLGLSLYTVSGHTYLSQRVGFAERGRSIGLFEVSWAAALLVGAPIVALLITRFGWRGPFVAVAVLAGVAAAVIARTESIPLDDHALTSVERADRVPLTSSAWQVLLASSAIAVAGLATIVVTGTWLDERLSVSTAGVGLAAMAFGAAELLGSISSAAISDRLGKSRSTAAALGLVLVGLAIMSVADTSLVVAIVGLLCFFLGFEYAIVTSFSVVSEAMPGARGRVLTMNTALGTAARGAASAAAGVLYAAFGIAGPASLSAIAAAMAMALLVGHQRTDAGRSMAMSERR